MCKACQIKTKEVVPVSDNHTLLDSIMSVFVPIHPDGYKFVGIGTVATLLAFLFLPSSLFWIFLVLTIYVAYFFRDPDRMVPQADGLIIAPADGLVSAVEEVVPPAELGFGGQKMIRISIFLNVFNVHINRSPVAGEIVRIEYIKGLFLNADLDKASQDNERNSMVIETRSGQEIGVVQIAGFIARRIVCFVKEGDSIEAGGRFGLIRFGSRTDVYFPLGSAVRVAEGQIMIGGETVLADMTAEGNGDYETRRV